MDEVSFLSCVELGGLATTVAASAHPRSVRARTMLFLVLLLLARDHEIHNQKSLGSMVFGILRSL